MYHYWVGIITMFPDPGAAPLSLGMYHNGVGNFSSTFHRVNDGARLCEKQCLIISNLKSIQF